MFALQLHETLNKYELNINDFYSVDYNPNRRDVKLQGDSLGDTQDMRLVGRVNATRVQLNSDDHSDRFHTFTSHIPEDVSIEMTLVDPIDNGIYEPLRADDPDILLEVPAILHALRCSEEDFYNIHFGTEYDSSLRVVHLQGHYKHGVASRIATSGMTPDSTKITDSGFIELTFKDILGRRVRIVLA